LCPKQLRSKLSTRLLQEVRARQFFQPGDRVAVAVSAGADSVALLHLLLELRAKLGIVLSVAHFNHQLRGRASDADEKFVATLAAKHALPFHAGRADVAANAKRDRANLEDAGRRARYAFFDQLIASGHAARIAVAHTADDQAETVLAHILRGTGLAGLGGIHPVAGKAGAIIRPLLPLRRADLRAYLRAKKQSWREDATNRDTAKTRAHIRKKLIPLLEKSFQPGVVQHLASLAELAREDETYLRSTAEFQASALSQKTEDAISIRVADLLGWSPKRIREPAPPSRMTPRASISKRLIRVIVHELKPHGGQLTAPHVQSVLQLAECGENGKRLRLPGGVEVGRENATLIFRAISAAAATPKGTKSKQPATDPAKHFAYDIDLAAPDPAAGRVLNVPYLACAFRLSLIDWPAKRGETSDVSSVLDCDALRPPLVLRNWRPGDIFRPSGHSKAHKLKRLMNRNRIPRPDRDGWPVLTSGGILVWARGFPVAADFAATERTRVGILIAEEKLS
jgi:tRNA(Ile)-lysidine synthase